jgi:hypothetical protein
MIIKLVRKVVKPVANIVKAVAPIAAPILAIAAPGIGTAIGAALGASAAAAPIVGSAVLGAAGSAIGGKNPLTGAVLGGGAAYLSGLLNAPVLGDGGGGAAELASVGQTGYGLTGPIDPGAALSAAQIAQQGYSYDTFEAPGYGAASPTISATNALRGLNIANQLMNPPEQQGMPMDQGGGMQAQGVDYSGLLGLMQRQVGMPNIGGLLAPAQIRYPNSLLG